VDMLQLSGFIPRAIQQSNTALSYAPTNTTGRFTSAVFYLICTGSVGSNPTRGIDLCLRPLLVVLSCVSRCLMSGPVQAIATNCTRTAEGLGPHWAVAALRHTLAEYVYSPS
jgi:hypothetical protein